MTGIQRDPVTATPFSVAMTGFRNRNTSQCRNDRMQQQQHLLVLQ